MKSYIHKFGQFGILESSGTGAATRLQKRIRLGRLGLDQTQFIVLIVHLNWMHLLNAKRYFLKALVLQQPNYKFIGELGSEGWIDIGEIGGFNSAVYSEAGRKGLEVEEFLTIHSNNLSALDSFIKVKATEATAEFDIDYVHVITHGSSEIAVCIGTETVNLQFPEDWWLVADDHGEFSRIDQPDLTGLEL